MESLFSLPEWLGTSIIAAVLAALGYVLKTLIELYQAYKERKRKRRSSLIELQSLLKAAYHVFLMQNKHAIKLTSQIKSNPEYLSKNASEHDDFFDGYEDIITAAYQHFNKEQKEFHSIIRSMTISALSPTNKAMLEWLRKDEYFKSNKSKQEPYAELSKKLAVLETHLILWQAKYEAWIPSFPEHALIYLNDEKKHGIGFPSGIDKLVEDAVNKF